MYDIAIVSQKKHELICPPERQVQQRRRSIVWGPDPTLVRGVQRRIIRSGNTIAVPNQQLDRIAVRCERPRYLVYARLYPPPSNQRHLHFRYFGKPHWAWTCSTETVCAVKRRVRVNPLGLAVSCHIGLHHHMHECLKRGLGCPAQPGTGF